MANLRASVGDAPEVAPPAWVAEAIAKITRYLAGSDEDLGVIPIDLEGLPPFHGKVYALARSIGRGRTRTYGEVAIAAGSPGGSRAVGQAMAKNPLPLVVPCHRVVGADGKPGGFSAPGGRETKTRLLVLEGALLLG
jgi:methylated-DNA-[protein]-cysteine S-methyltransferase